MGENKLFKIGKKIAKGIRSPDKAYSYLSRIEPIYFFTERKLSYDDLREFGEEFNKEKETLIIYIEFPYGDLLKNTTELPDHHGNYDRYFDELESISDESYPQIVATGVLEHVSDPERFISECYRILEPGGELYVSASSTFSVHCGPEDYFHVTHYGMRELLKDQEWSDIKIRGSCDPFKTIGMLLQRILLQCRTRFFIRPFVSILARVIPLLDRFIISQHHDRKFSQEGEIDSMMPSNIQLIAKK